MKKLFILILFIAATPHVQAQFIVEAPLLETIATNQTSILGTMNFTMAALEQAEKKVEALKKITGWIEKLESMQEFIQLLETTGCMARDLDLDLKMAMQLIGPRSSCLNEFQYRININRLRYVVDIINLVLTDGFSMSREGRMKAYHDALTTFQMAQLGLQDLAVFLKRIIGRYERAKRYKKELLTANDFSRYKK
jgi:hypothetical protein